MWEIILALMCALQPPGRSIYSLVEIQADQNPAPPAAPSCPEATSLLCAPPRWLSARSAWVRPETADEGLARYEVIARELAAVSTWASGGDVGEGWPPLHRYRWRGRPEALARVTMMFAYHESGWREDVHAGETAFDQADTSKGDQGESWCLTQQRMGRSPTARRKYPVDRYAAAELVGTSPEATRRCLIAATDVIGSAQERCRRQGNAHASCLVVGYSGGNLLDTDKAVRRRVATLMRIETLWRDAVKRGVGSPATSSQSADAGAAR